mmetsp:Transcript_29411/g.70723  ORF Transcript_29411/g.70723 Transcript_29411/m.70723 type:complete len:164 (+) Transcript_29411:341-832(+)|eukprot:CAMPEP_0113644858 /NCGR_PEP_ID=MMETSP0017_2-20120614/23618_1 /TAXON_ID=2856 /ORGANISM="Cylindrotheca closterium" /LENGTH=163 /DNA_ID=CAMNT_0000556509 /DNA_START=82 /DNA_END=573 /DNA_ORIENTATION=- /assembly_acc=CAM_ASM_000147
MYISEEERKKLFGANLEDRSKITKSSAVQHHLKHKVGSLNLMEGENWLDMMIGVVHESSQEHSHQTAYTGVCFDVDGTNDLAVKNTSPETQISIARDGNDGDDDDDDDEENFTTVPCLQLRILHHGDKIRIVREKLYMHMSQTSIVLTYDRRNKKQAGDEASM